MATRSAALARIPVPASLWQVELQPLAIEDIIRRELLVGAAGLLLLPAGCGGGKSENAASDGMSTVKHALGTLVAPKNPRRVVDLTGGARVDQLLALGVVLTASMYWGQPRAENAMPTWFDEVEWLVGVSADAIENVGIGEGVNVEEIACLEPNLIIGWDYAFDIAPSAGITPTNGPRWEKGFREVAQALGQEDGYESWRESYDASMEELRPRFDGDPEEHTVSMLWIGDPSQLYIYSRHSQPGSMVPDAGFEMPPITDTDLGGDLADIASPQVSMEKIPEVDADVIFLMTYLDDPRVLEEFNSTYGASPLWRLEAVKRDRVYPVDIALWTNGGPSGIRDLVLPELLCAIEGEREGGAL